MASENVYNFEGFSEDKLLTEEIGLGIDAESDISFSSVNTSDLSDFSELQDEDEIFWGSDQWTENVVESTRPSEVTSFVGPTHPLGLDATPVEYFFQLFPIKICLRKFLFKRIYTRDNKMLLTLFPGVHLKYARTSEYFSEWESFICRITGVIGVKKVELNQSSIADIMPRNRYDELTRYFHLNDSSTNPSSTSPRHDKLHKIRPVIQNAKRQFRYHYEPHKTLSVDEGMIKFKGSSFLQYMPNKPTKWGFKAWGIADSDSYLLDFDIYTGKDSYPDRTMPLGTYVVTELARNYYGKNHHTYFDIFFTSVPLMESLLEEKTYACSTIRRNRRGLPHAFKNCKLPDTGDMKKFQKVN